MKLSRLIVIEKKAADPSTSFILTGGQIGKGGTGLDNSEDSYIKRRKKEKGGTLITSDVIYNTISKKQVSIIP